MNPSLARLWRHHRLLLIGFVLAVALMAVFVVRLGISAAYWSSHREQVVADWMPLGYVARSWDMPPEILAEAIQLAPGSAPRQSLAEIARSRGEPVDVLIARINAAIVAHQAGRDD